MLKIDNLDVFLGKKHIIHDASFSLSAGRIMGLVGSNGAGKTTIMKTILGLTKFNGSVDVDGQPVSEVNHKALSEVGALIEHPAIYPFLTGKENLELYSKSSSDLNNIVSMLEMDSYINNKAKKYSLGMKQKLGIALALLNKPKLVILDEPMNGLDINATILVRKVIKEYANNGTSFLISSHVLSELQKIMTDIVIVNQGNIVINSTVADLINSSQTKYKIVSSDNHATLSILQTHDIPVESVDDYLLVDSEFLKTAQDIMYKNNIYLNELTSNTANFENMILEFLDNKKGDSDGS